MVRAYAPVGAVELDSLARADAFTAERVVAVTAQIEALAPDGDAELHEHLAAQVAAALATSDPVAVCAFDVGDERVSVRTEPEVSGEVDLVGDVARRNIACFLVADPGHVVSAEADLELSWYDVTELGEVRRHFA